MTLIGFGDELIHQRIPFRPITQRCYGIQKLAKFLNRCRFRQFGDQASFV